MALLIIIFLMLYAVVVYYVARFVIVLKFKKRKTRLVNQLKYYGYYALTLSYTVSTFIAGILVLLYNLDCLIHTHGQLLIIIVSNYIIISLIVMYATNPELEVRNYFEHNIKLVMLCVSSVSFVITILIIASVLFETYKFFKIVSITDFLTSMHWSPSDDVQNANLGKKFGIIPLLVGTLLITFISLVVATPIGIFSAIFLSEYTDNKLRFLLKPIVEMLSGIPTVVYGYFAALYMGPYIRNVGESYHFTVSSESALAAGIVLGVMVIPYVISLADDMFKSIPDSIREASFALGATKFETIIKIVVPAAKSGLVGAVMLAFSRAIGETMIVTMASGLMARLTFNPLDSVTTVTAQIVSILTGDQEFNNIKTLAAFALAFTLFCLTLILNFFAHNFMIKYQNQFR